MKEENNVRNSNSWARNKARHRVKTGEHATTNQLGTTDFKSGKEIKLLYRKPKTLKFGDYRYKL